MCTGHTLHCGLSFVLLTCEGKTKKSLTMQKSAIPKKQLYGIILIFKKSYYSYILDLNNKVFYNLTLSIPASFDLLSRVDIPLCIS